MNTKGRPQWGSRLGFILAAAGSAVGLGNIWRFPYVTGRNGGAAFVLIYLLCIVAVALPVQWLELSLGRRTKKNPVGAFEAASGPGSPWKIIGYMGVIVGIGILSYYSVVAGWTLGYIVMGAFGDLMDKSVKSADIFAGFTANPAQQIGLMVLFMAVTGGVVWGGVKEGIERITKVLMPVLVLLMVILIVRAVTLPQAGQGLAFYLKPDFSKVSGQTFLYALGQAFFTLSLGMGAMLTYGSYLDKKEDLGKCGLHVAVFDTAIALMAGFIIFPVLGGAPAKAGPGLVFIVLIDVFREIPAGQLVAIVFFLLLAIAALTSTISLAEVAVSYLIDQHKWKRRNAVLATIGVAAALGIPSALGISPGLGSSKALTNFITIGGTQMGFLDLMDYLFGNLFLCLGGFLLCIFAAMRWGIAEPTEEISRNSTVFPPVAGLWRFSVLYLAPLATAWVVVYLLAMGKSL